MNQHRGGINKDEDLEVQPSLIYPPWEPRTHLVEQLHGSQGGGDQGLRQYCLQKPGTAALLVQVPGETDHFWSPQLGLCSEDGGEEFTEEYVQAQSDEWLSPQIKKNAFL